MDTNRFLSRCHLSVNRRTDRLPTVVPPPTAHPPTHRSMKLRSRRQLTVPRARYSNYLVGQEFALATARSRRRRADPRDERDREQSRFLDQQAEESFFDATDPDTTEETKTETNAPTDSDPIWSSPPIAPASPFRHTVPAQTLTPPASQSLDAASFSHLPSPSPFIHAPPAPPAPTPTLASDAKLPTQDNAPNAHPPNTHPSNAQPSNAQPSNAQPSNAQPSNAQPSNAQPSNAQPSNAQPLALDAARRIVLKLRKKATRAASRPTPLATTPAEPTAPVTPIAPATETTATLPTNASSAAAPNPTPPSTTITLRVPRKHADAFYGLERVLTAEHGLSGTDLHNLQRIHAELHSLAARSLRRPEGARHTHEWALLLASALARKGLWRLDLATLVLRAAQWWAALPVPALCSFLRERAPSVTGPSLLAHPDPTPDMPKFSRWSHRNLACVCDHPGKLIACRCVHVHLWSVCLAWALDDLFP
jgi:hypothetical protein